MDPDGLVHASAADDEDVDLDARTMRSMAAGAMGGDDATMHQRSGGSGQS